STRATRTPASSRCPWSAPTAPLVARRPRRDAQQPPGTACLGCLLVPAALAPAVHGLPALEMRGNAPYKEVDSGRPEVDQQRAAKTGGGEAGQPGTVAAALSAPPVSVETRCAIPVSNQRPRRPPRRPA